MFKSPKTIQDLCKEFKEKLTLYMKEKKLEVCHIELKDVENFFSFSSSKLKYEWLPKRFREGLKEEGVKLVRKRNSNIIEVKLRGE